MEENNVANNVTETNAVENAAETDQKNMKVCKTCGKAIAKDAKTCPHCGAVQKSSPLIIIIVIVAILAVICTIASGIKKCSGGASSDDGTSGEIVVDYEMADDEETPDSVYISGEEEDEAEESVVK